MLNETERKILSFLIYKSDRATRTVIININDLAKQIKKSYRTVYRCIKSMSEKRVIEKINKHLYKINYSYKIYKIYEIKRDDKQKETSKINIKNIKLESISTEELKELLLEIEKELKKRKKDLRKEKKEKRYLSF